MGRDDDAKRVHESALARVKATAPPSGQKFAPGSRVRIADDLGPSMSHFPKGRLATVMHTYAHAYDTDDPRDLKTYCLDVDGVGRISWYDEDQLTAVEDDWPDVVG